jgi:hypothetical protein
LKQQPEGQVVESQIAAMQPPSWQLVLPAQAPHEAPPLPQLLGEVPGWQTPSASQQPLGQVAALHCVTQAFCMQLPRPQLRQAMPPLPHAASLVPLRHTPPWQQPFAQFEGPHASSHCWSVQVVLHIEHATPPRPHASGSVPATQTPFWQQPPGHVCGLQVPSHAPASHEPAPHETQAMAPRPQESV